MKYLTADDIISIHDEVLRRFGGGERGIYPEGRGRLDSMLARMKEGFFGCQPFESLIQKAAFQFQSILQYHPFVDGMKRTGIYASISFLLLNDYVFFSKNKEEDVRFAIRVADELTQVDPTEALSEIVSWFENRVFYLFDKEHLLRYVMSSMKKLFICPRCRGNRITIESPFCKDCAEQLIKIDFIMDGIVLKRKIHLEREITRSIYELHSPNAKFNWALSEIR